MIDNLSSVDRFVKECFFSDFSRMDYEREKPSKRLTKGQAKAKAEHFCAYQERCQQEVRDKLYSWGLFSNEVEEVIAELILENFINEERFTKAYVSGKFRLKGWGRIKIVQGLKLRKISPRLIQEGLKELDSIAYEQALVDLLQKKAASLKESDPFKRKGKLVQYAMGRGYEQEVIFDILNNNNL